MPAALAPASRAAALVFSIALASALAPHAAFAAPSIRQAAAGPPTALRSEAVLDKATLESWGIAHPSRLAFDAEGALYVLDTSRRRLVKVGTDGRLIHEVALSGDDPSSSTEPADVVVDARGSVLVLDRSAASVLAYDKNGALLAARPFAADLTEEARDPRASLLLDAFGRLWLLAPRERDLVQLDTSLAPDRAGRFLTPEDSVGTPGAAAATPNGEAWIVDRLSGALHRYRASGALAGTARFDSTAAAVAALAADGSGYVYAADARGERILVFGSDGARVLERAVGGPARRWNPAALAWSPRDRLAAADPDNGEVQIFAIERSSP